MGRFGATKSATPASQLGDLIRKGPLVGIHVIVWSDTFSNAMRWLSNSLLREFDSRIAFRLNQTDSSSLIDTPAAASLSPGRAILYRDQTGAADRFRPFSWPSQQWLANVPASPEVEFIPAVKAIEQTVVAATPAPEPSVAESMPFTETVPVAELKPVAEAIEPAISEPVIGQPAAVKAVPIEAPTVAAETESTPADLRVPEVQIAEVQVAEAITSQTATTVAEPAPLVEGVNEVVAEVPDAASAKEVVAPAALKVQTPEVKTVEVSVPAAKVDAPEPTSSKVKPIPVTESVANAVASAAQPPAGPAAEKAQPLAKPLASKPEAPKPGVPKEPIVVEKPVIAEKPAVPPAKTAAKQKPSGKSPAKPVAETPKSAPPKPAPAPVQSPEPQAPAAVTPVSTPPVTLPVQAPELVAASADDDMDFVLDDSVFAKAVPPAAPTLPPAAPKPTGPVPPTPAAVAPEAAPKKVGKPTAMAVRLSSRRTDHNRLLDAPPEPKVPTEPRLSPDQEAPSSDFDEMDFNSLMIE
jgi:nicotinate-nucleotide--dimethylbenzimidazole phosphoribosyltransferase